MKVINWIRSWKLWVKILIPVLAVLLAVGIYYGAKAWTVVEETKEMVSQIQDTGDFGSIREEEVVMTYPEYQKDYLNLLVVGIDYDENYEDRTYGGAENAKTDLILYIHYNVKDNKASILQIPRDCYVGEMVSNYRINSIFAEGENKQSHITNLAKYINEAFGLPVDKFVSLDMAAFKEIVDVFGGIDIYLPEDIYLFDDAGNRVLFASAGQGRFNGADAEIVVRARKQFAQGDVQRLMLQRYVYAAMFEMISNATMENMYRHILPIVSWRVKSDMDFDTMLSLCTKVLELEGEDIFFVRVPGGPVTVDGQSVYGVNAANLAPILNEHFLIEGQPELLAEELTIPTGWEYPLGEILDKGSYLSDQLEEIADANAPQEGAAEDAAGESAAEEPAA